MRRNRTLACVVLVLLALGWLHGSAPAQQFAPVPASGLILSNQASITAVNSSSEISLFQFLIFPGLTATATSVGAVASPIYTGGTASGLSTTSGGVTPTGALSTTAAPLHFRAIGMIAGAAGTTFNIGVNLNDGIAPPSTGAGTATLSLNNINLVSTISGPGTPVRLDVYIQAIATGTATPNNPNNAFMSAVLRFVNASGTETVINAGAVVGINFATPTRLNVVGRWAAAASSSMFTFYNRILKIAE